MFNRIASLLTICLLLISVVWLNGCNTVEGAGKDIERGGEHLQDAAD
ncbi:MAG: entericidin A/B family lipoprotein [Phycisphaeraceae bacterium]|nr:entericidin A/B family lipoprotein [Phycisphaeraceae bacterium]